MQDRYPVSYRRRVCARPHLSEYLVLQTRGRDAAALRMRICEIAQARPRFGYVRIWIMLRREGWPDNKKRIHRLYRLEGLQVRMRCAAQEATPSASRRGAAGQWPRSSVEHGFRP